MIFLGNVLSVFLGKKESQQQLKTLTTIHQDFSTMKQFTQKSKYKHGNNCIAVTLAVLEYLNSAV